MNAPGRSWPVTRYRSREHQQKLERVRSGIRAAQKAGKWTGRPPRGFEVGGDGYLHVAPTEFLETREALARVERGDSRRKVSEEAGIPYSTLSRLYEDRRELYLADETDDDRVRSAVEELAPLDDLTSAEAGELEARLRQIVREELHSREE